MEDEGPIHSVTINYDFSMGKYEITQRQWLAVMGSWPGVAPSSEYGMGDNYPAYFVLGRRSEFYYCIECTYYNNRPRGGDSASA